MKLITTKKEDDDEDDVCCTCNEKYTNIIIIEFIFLFSGNKLVEER